MEIGAICIENNDYETARKAFKQSAVIRIEEVTLQNIDKKLPKMTALYEKVASNANFNLGSFNLETYKDLKEKFPDAIKRAEEAFKIFKEKYNYRYINVNKLILFYFYRLNTRKILI